MKNHSKICLPEPSADNKIINLNYIKNREKITTVSNYRRYIDIMSDGTAISFMLVVIALSIVYGWIMSQRYCVFGSVDHCEPGAQYYILITKTTGKLCSVMFLLTNIFSTKIFHSFIQDIPSFRRKSLNWRVYHMLCAYFGLFFAFIHGLLHASRGYGLAEIAKKINSSSSANNNQSNGNSNSDGSEPGGGVNTFLQSSIDNIKLFIPKLVDHFNAAIGHVIVKTPEAKGADINEIIERLFWHKVTGIVLVIILFTFLTTLFGKISRFFFRKYHDNITVDLFMMIYVIHSFDIWPLAFIFIRYLTWKIANLKFKSIQVDDSSKDLLILTITMGHKVSHDIGKYIYLCIDNVRANFSIIPLDSNGKCFSVKIYGEDCAIRKKYNSLAQTHHFAEISHAGSSIKTITDDGLSNFRMYGPFSSTDITVRAGSIIVVLTSGGGIAYWESIRSFQENRHYFESIKHISLGHHLAQSNDSQAESSEYQISACESADDFGVILDDFLHSPGELLVEDAKILKKQPSSLYVCGNIDSSVFNFICDRLKGIHEDADILICGNLPQELYQVNKLNVDLRFSVHVEDFKAY